MRPVMAAVACTGITVTNMSRGKAELRDKVRGCRCGWEERGAVLETEAEDGAQVHTRTPPKPTAGSYTAHDGGDSKVSHRWKADES